MLSSHLITTVNQRILSLLAKYPDKELYERQIARRIGISSGSANRALNELHYAGVIKRRREGRMYFYSVDLSNAAIAKFKILINILLLEPLIEDLRSMSSKAILYGSCASGGDTSESDMDLFIVSDKRDQIIQTIDRFTFPPGFEDLHIQPVIKTPVELLDMSESEQAFIDEVEQGIVLWERKANEPGV